MSTGASGSISIGIVKAEIAKLGDDSTVKPPASLGEAWAVELNRIAL
jgi:hypothetical protein